MGGVSAPGVLWAGGTYEDDKSDDNYAWYVAAPCCKPLLCSALIWLGISRGDDEDEVEVRLTREQLINHISRRRRKFKHLAQLPYLLMPPPLRLLQLHLLFSSLHFNHLAHNSSN